MLLNNEMLKKLANDVPVIGTWNTLGAPLVTEVIAQSGFDFQIIDLEHGPFMLDQVHLQVSACEGSSTCTPLVRVPTNKDWMVLQALDQGAHGVVVPHVSDRQAAELLTKSVKYHPVGERGFTPFSKAGGFNSLDVSGYVSRANEATATVVIIESKEGLANLDEIASTEGVDVVYFGAYDLSQALGHPGETKHPDVVRSIRQGIDVVCKNGKTAGGFVPRSRDDIKWVLDMGMRFITYEVDSAALFSHMNGVSEWFEKETGR